MQKVYLHLHTFGLAHLFQNNQENDVLLTTGAIYFHANLLEVNTKE